jgi:hypothetical protein
MKTTMIYLLIFFSTLFSCNSQDLNKKQNKDEKKKPHENVTVNRKYDKDGNLIEFDSTYTAYYSNFSSDTLNIDSLMSDFHPFFNNKLFGSEYLFNSFLQEDSVLNPHFFHNDFYEQQFVNQNEEMLKMIQKMDSVKNAFFENKWK